MKLDDALTALANGLNLRAKLAYAGGVCGQWLMDHNSDKSIWFHLVSKGSGWVHSPAWAEPARSRRAKYHLAIHRSLPGSSRFGPSAKL